MGSVAAVSAMPRATPAWGSKVMPRLSVMGLGCLVSAQLLIEPKYLPADRAII